MCIDSISCFVLMILIPINETEFEKHTYATETRTECQILAKIWVKKLEDDDDYDSDAFGAATITCRKGLDT